VSQRSIQYSAEAEDIVVQVGTDGTLIRVKDVGRAKWGAQDYSATSILMARPGRSYSLSTSPAVMPGIQVDQVPKNGGVGTKFSAIESDRLRQHFVRGSFPRGSLQNPNGGDRAGILSDLRLLTGLCTTIPPLPFLFP